MIINTNVVGLKNVNNQNINACTLINNVTKYIINYNKD